MDAAAWKALAEQGSARVSVTIADPPVSPAAPTAPALGGVEGRARRAAQLQEAFLAELPPGKFRLRYRYRYSPAVLLEVLDASGLDALEASARVSRAALDARGTGGLVQSRRLIGADRVHAFGLTGEGKVVAVLDTGVDSDHPDLADAVIHQRHFLFQGESTGLGAEDGHGHGTHVTGILTSRGRAGAPRGVAPGLQIVSVKVLDDTNSGWLSDWAAGLEYVIDLSREEGGIHIDVVNMSLVSTAEFEGPCEGFVTPLEAACDTARELGIALFACSGNTGSTTALTSPGCYGSTFSVGSVWDSLPDTISSFTSRNPYLSLLAPGQVITSAAVGGGAANLSGCSMATPHAAAAAALLLELQPDLAPEQLLQILASTAVAVRDTRTSLVFPRVDALAAIRSLSSPEDCDLNGVSDTIDIALGRLEDKDQDGIADRCEERTFRRGDANADGPVNLSDAVSTFLFLFGGQPERVPCQTAADADDSGEIVLADGVFTLNFLFRSGPPSPPPGPSGCGSDPTADLSCTEYTACP